MKSATQIEEVAVSVRPDEVLLNLVQVDFDWLWQTFNNQDQTERTFNRFFLWRFKENESLVTSLSFG